jgi:hypothetical protein
MSQRKFTAIAFDTQNCQRLQKLGQVPDFNNQIIVRLLDEPIDEKKKRQLKT